MRTADPHSGPVPDAALAADALARVQGRVTILDAWAPVRPDHVAALRARYEVTL